jgi:hypothetical protein
MVVTTQRGMRIVALLGFVTLALVALDVGAASSPEPPQEASPTGACLAFGAACNAGDKCCDAAGGWGICHAFGRGSRCTVTCPSDATTCPNAGRGCNNQSPPVCKVGKRPKGKKKHDE